MTPVLRTPILLAAGAVLAIASAWASVQLTAQVRGACGGYEPPYGMALLFISFPMTAVTAWGALAAVIGVSCVALLCLPGLTARRRRPRGLGPTDTGPT